MNFASEQFMEETLIQKLISGKSQWTYRDDLRTEEDLWRNFRQKLENNNKDILKDVPLTEQEFYQVKNQLSFSSFYKAAQWLAGENGVAKVEVQREDAKLGTIRLRVVNRQDVAGGTSSYEVINQFQTEKRSLDDRNRRFDVTLLINGLPMIHIELKNRAHPYMDAFRQIKKYLKEGKFTGIYSTVQMFVMTNGSDTRYIASAQSTKLNEQFLTKWVDEENHPVTDYLEFAQDVLSIPMAHKMVTQYTVLDSSKKALILLRPYQIHAIEAVKQASTQQKSGYVWHTTGSGKTLTSYKVARNLLQIPSIQKTIFIVDRVDLDQQTTSSFTSYAEHDVIDIDETDNVNDLINKLLSDDRTVIVTTIQKLNYVMRRYGKHPESKKYQRLTQLRVAFVVDECHRAVSSGKKREIEEFFIYSLWYGFTGTPIFAENNRKAVGDLARTTQQLYGDKLHEYTVKEAIHDHAVLGFQVEYKSTLSEEQMDKVILQTNASDKLAINTLELAEKEGMLTKTVYENEKHMLEVLNSIFNKSQKKLGFNRGSGQTFDAILTTSSIAQAQKYFDLVQQIKAGESPLTIDEETKRILPDFPKVAITYSISENEEASIDNQEKMKESLRIYNEEFGTSFQLDTMRAYNRDVNNRLARKKDKYSARSEQLDLVIVVDRLLTGFDAPCLSTLFIDRPPMQLQDLIQAFSRTNRLFDKEKKYGQIVTFQTPLTFEQKVKEALLLYSNGGENEVLAPDWQEAKAALIQAVKELKRVVATPSQIDIDRMEIVELKKFVKLFQAVDKTFTAVQVYTDYDDKQLESVFNISLAEIEAYTGKYQNALERIKMDKDEDGLSDLEIDISYELESIKTDKINYEYILMLIQTFVPSGNDEYELVSRVDDKAASEINRYIDDLAKNNVKLAEFVRNLWQDVQANPEDYRDQNISLILEEKIDEEQKAVIHNYAEKWVVDEETAQYVAYNYKPKKEKQVGEQELKQSADYDEYKASTDKPVSKLKYWKYANQEFKEIVQNEILPLRDR